MSWISSSGYASLKQVIDMRTVLVFGNQGSLQYIFLKDTFHVPNVKNMTKAIFNYPITELKFQHHHWTQSWYSQFVFLNLSFITWNQLLHKLSRDSTSIYCKHLKYTQHQPSPPSLHYFCNTIACPTFWNLKIPVFMVVTTCRMVNS